MTPRAHSGTTMIEWIPRARSIADRAGSWACQSAIDSSGRLCTEPSPVTRHRAGGEFLG